MCDELRIRLPTKVWNSLPPELWIYINEILESMEYEDLWKKTKYKIQEKKNRETLRLYYEHLFYKEYERDYILELLHKKALTLGIKNIRERIYNPNECFLAIKPKTETEYNFYN